MIIPELIKMKRPIEITEKMKDKLRKAKPIKIGTLYEPIEFKDCVLHVTGAVVYKNGEQGALIDLECATIKAEHHNVEIEAMPLGKTFWDAVKND